MACSCSVLNSPIRNVLLEGEVQLCTRKSGLIRACRLTTVEPWNLSKQHKQQQQQQQQQQQKSENSKSEAKNEFFRPPLGWTFSPGNFHLLSSSDIEYRHKEGSRYGVAVESTPPPPRQKKNDGDKGKDYHVNVGYAIRSLREELPGMFYKEPTFEIYRDDIVFRDPLITFRGINNYKLMFWGLRFYGRVFFKAIWIEILRIWQPSDRVIMVRWTVHGIPRVPWESKGQFDGTSEYKLDSEGLICEHKVDNVIMNSPPKYKAPAVLDLVVAAGGQPATTSFFRCLVLRFTWVRFYLALRGTLAFNTAGALC